jgi:hypothetical protein
MLRYKNTLKNIVECFPFSTFHKWYGRLKLFLTPNHYGPKNINHNVIPKKIINARTTIWKIDCKRILIAICEVIILYFLE